MNTSYLASSPPVFFISGRAKLIKHACLVNHLVDFFSAYLTGVTLQVNPWMAIPYCNYLTPSDGTQLRSSTVVRARSKILW